MKKLLIPLLSLVIFAVGAVAQEASAPAAGLKAGAAVKIEPVTSAQWIQGEPLKAFEADKVYLFECWATTCSPCVAAIPHVNELHQKYFAKGLRVIGMNVWEDGKEKVTKFVKDKGDGMSYPVAYTGKVSPFDREWLTAAGVRSIPNTFVVKNGRILLIAHPSLLTDEVIEALLAGGEDAQRAIGQIEAENQAREKGSDIVKAYRAAAAEGDTATMAAKLEELVRLLPKNPVIPMLKGELVLAKRDWAGATKMLNEGDAEPGRAAMVTVIAQKTTGLGQESGCPPEFSKTVAQAYAPLVSAAKTPQPTQFVTLSMLQWKAGDEKSAVASAHKAVEAAGSPASIRFPVAPLERFVKALESGTLPTAKEFSDWLTAARRANR